MTLTGSQRCMHCSAPLQAAQAQQLAVDRGLETAGLALWRAVIVPLLAALCCNLLVQLRPGLLRLSAC